MAAILQLAVCVISMVMLGCQAQDEAAIPARCYWAWSPWQSWSRCSVTCGTGYQVRTRNCVRRGICFQEEFLPGNPRANASDAAEASASRLPFVNIPVQCPGSSIERRKCQMKPCPCSQVNGGWSAWGCWGECNRAGLRQRHRVCNRPIPQGWGTYCQGIPTQVEKCKACAAAQDIVFTIDGSGSVGPTNFQLIITEVNSLIQSFDLDAGAGPVDKVRVGISLFNHGQILKKHLNNFSIPSVPYAYPSFGTNIGGAISHAQYQMFTTGNRTPNPDTLVVITDGYSANALAAANAAKSAGIKIIAVGFGNSVNVAHLQQIASDPATDVYKANNFCEIGQYLRKRFDCDEVVPSTLRQCSRFVQDPTSAKDDAVSSK